MTTRNALALAILAGAASAAQADLVAYWNFNASTAGTGGSLGVLQSPAGFNASQGSGNMTTNIAINTNNVTADGTLGTFAGTVTNVILPDGSGGALAVQNGTNGLNNGKWVQFNVSTAAISSALIMTYASQRTGTGFTSQDVSYSSDGVTFTPFTSVTTVTTSFGTNIYTVDFSAADVYLKPNLAIRFTFNGGSVTSAAGNNRIDNLQLNGVVPTPGALALLGMGGLIAGRRRRA